MPFASEAQRRFMFAKHPKLAQEFADKTPPGADLPEHVKDKARKSGKSVAAQVRDTLRYTKKGSK